MNNNTNLPSQESIKNLDKLAQDFPPTSVKYLLSLEGDFSLQECNDCGEGMIDRLKDFVENKNNNEGLKHPYKSVSRF